MQIISTHQVRPHKKSLALENTLQPGQFKAESGSSKNNLLQSDQLEFYVSNSINFELCQALKYRMCG